MTSGSKGRENQYYTRNFNEKIYSVCADFDEIVENAVAIKGNANINPQKLNKKHIDNPRIVLNGWFNI